MKSIRSILVVAAAGLALAVGLAFAQSPGGRAGMHRGGHMMGGSEFARIFHQLNLTDEQKAQIKQIHESEKTTLKPLMQQEFQAHQQMMQLIVSDKPLDLKQAQILASQEANVHMQLEVEHAKMFAQVYQLLTSDQKAKVSEILAKHQQFMQQHMQNEQAPAPSQQ